MLTDDEQFRCEMFEFLFQVSLLQSSVVSDSYH